jgi:hypothetical protein
MDISLLGLQKSSLLHADILYSEIFVINLTNFDLVLQKAVIIFDDLNKKKFCLIYFNFSFQYQIL